jgi:endonuclease YncB( thermonuclease family)
MTNVNQKMINEGHAVAYFGGSKSEIQRALIEARVLSKEYVEKHVKPLD